MRKDFLDQVVITLRASGDPSFTIKSAPDQVSKLVSIEPGSVVTLRCSTISRFAGRPSAQGCELKSAV